MKLTDGERLIILMLAQQGDKSRRATGDEIDPAFVRRALLEGQTWAIREKYSAYFPEQDASDELVKEVTNFLWMWTLIEEAVEKLPDDERAAVEAAAGYPGALRFSGFDGNHEGDHRGVARTRIEMLDQYARFRGRALSGETIHAVPRYRRMWAAFWGLLQNRDRDKSGLLDKNELLTVIRKFNEGLD